MFKTGRLLSCLLAVPIVTLWAWWVIDGVWITLASVVLGCTLLALAITDWQRLILPDRSTIPLIFGGLAMIAVLRPGALLLHIAGAALGYVIFWLIGVAYRRWRGGEGLGRGDAKLIAAAGSWVGLAGLPSTVLIGSLTGLIYAAVLSIRHGRWHAGRRLPFGSFLCLGIWVTWLYGPIRFFGS